MTAANDPIKTRKYAHASWTVAEAQAHLGATEWTIRRWIRTGHLDKVSGGGQGSQTRVRRVDPATFERSRPPRGRPPRQTPVSDDDYLQAVIKYRDLEAQDPLGMPFDEWQRLVAALCASYDMAKETMEHTSRDIDSLRRWPEDGFGAGPWGLLPLAQSAENLKESSERLGDLMLRANALTLQFGPYQWIGRENIAGGEAVPEAGLTIRADDWRMHVVHVLELAGATAPQIAAELSISSESVKTLKRRWSRGAWRRAVVTRYLARIDEVNLEDSYPPLRRPSSLKAPRRPGIARRSAQLP